VLIISETWRSSRSQSKQRSGVNGSIEELQIQVLELNERLGTWEAAASEERQQCVTSHHPYPCQLQDRHQELVRIMERVVEIGLRGGAWAELQNDTPLQPPRTQSDLPIPISSSPYVNAERTHTERPANTV
jgi:optic atrophy 3 protein